jgi:hypothetical protein
MKNSVFWDVPPCRSCVTQSAATYSRWFLARGFFYPENGSDMFLRNVGFTQDLHGAASQKTAFFKLFEIRLRRD